MKATTYRPDGVVRDGVLTWGASLCVDANGMVVDSAPPDAEEVRLPGQVIVPGLVNAHSHAFQRVIRGRTEFASAANASDDFWSWREAMYAAATTLTPDSIYLVSRQAFLEMALSGVTTVGEFHYIHHQPDGAPYPDEHAMALQVIRAAREVGLRIVLLRVAYARAGFQMPVNPRQRRFLDSDVDTALARTASLRTRTANDGLVSVGIAPHSVRALPRPWLEAIAESKQLTHIHVAEQPAEVKACLAEYSMRPVELLADTGVLHELTTGVHAVHIEQNEVELFAQGKSRVCACPSTERNLGDGIVPADQLLSAGVEVSLGSDSQALIDLFDEARQLEGHLRLARLKRNVLDPRSGEQTGLGRRLLAAATEYGARSLGLTNGAGTLRAGSSADFVTLDLAAPALAGVEASGADALTAMLFAAGAASVHSVFVAGNRIVNAGQHVLQHESAQAFSKCVKALISAS